MREALSRGGRVRTRGEERAVSAPVALELEAALGAARAVCARTGRGTHQVSACGMGPRVKAQAGVGGSGGGMRGALYSWPQRSPP